MSKAIEERKLTDIGDLCLQTKINDKNKTNLLPAFFHFS